MRFALIAMVTITTLAVTVTSSPTPILISRDYKSVSDLAKRNTFTSAVTGAAIVSGLCTLLQAPIIEAQRSRKEPMREEMEEENRAEKRSLQGWLAAAGATGWVVTDCLNDLNTKWRLDISETRHDTSELRLDLLEDEID